MEDVTRRIEREDIEAAFDRIGGRIRRTPILDLGVGAFGLDTPLELKLELLQHTGSFKASTGSCPPRCRAPG